jgi:hypothetical protein
MAYAIAIPVFLCLLAGAALYVAGYFTHNTPTSKISLVAGLLLGVLLFASNELPDKIVPPFVGDLVIVLFFVIPFLTQIGSGLVSNWTKR